MSLLKALQRVVNGVFLVPAVLLDCSSLRLIALHVLSLLAWSRLVSICSLCRHAHLDRNNAPREKSHNFFQVLDKRMSGLTNPVVGTCSVAMGEKMPWNDEGYKPPQVRARGQSVALCVKCKLSPASITFVTSFGFASIRYCFTSSNSNGGSDGTPKC